MSSLPASNATLTAINAPGLSEDYDEPATDGTPRWTGTVDCYVVNKIRTLVGTAGLNRVKTTYLVVPYDIGETVESGDTVVFTLEGESVSRVVWEIDPAKIAGTTRLHFQDAKVA